MKRQSPLFMGIIYAGLGALFTGIAIQTVNSSGWGIFAYILVLIATLDFGSGLRMIMVHFKIKAAQKNKKK
ncbi:YdiK family protein [Peribacillus muralis]|uniref:YdiK family protein n=1 Tax=Peribacillus muralis TaxID=264697 RepID=UPI00070FAAAF|nr:YdiK family protein [Peribacillus muralis]MCK1994895.1 YdiK family protein [Peribacillus muralis]MCK2015559.1 YdiK family protein [Peribacillus muralis]